MREYIMNLGTVMMMIAIANILIPDGGIKRFATLAMGFIIISTVIIPTGDIMNKFSLEETSFNESELDVEDAKASYRKEVLSKHKENLENKIKEHIKHSSEVSVSVTDEGEIEKIHIRLKGDESSAVAYITQTLKVQRERIIASYEDN